MLVPWGNSIVWNIPVFQSYFSQSSALCLLLGTPLLSLAPSTSGSPYPLKSGDHSHKGILKPHFAAAAWILQVTAACSEHVKYLNLKKTTSE